MQGRTESGRRLAAAARDAGRATARIAALAMLWLVVPAAALGAAYWQAWVRAAPRPVGSPPISRTDARLLSELPQPLVPASARMILSLRRSSAAMLAPDAPPLQLLAAADRQRTEQDSVRLCANTRGSLVCARITIGPRPGVTVSNHGPLRWPPPDGDLTATGWVAR